ELAPREAVVELTPVEVVTEARAEKIAVFRPVRQVIDGDDVIDALRIQSVDDLAADHAGSAGDDDSHGRRLHEPTARGDGCVYERGVYAEAGGGTDGRPATAAAAR